MISKYIFRELPLDRASNHLLQNPTKITSLQNCPWTNIPLWGRPKALLVKSVSHVKMEDWPFGGLQLVAERPFPPVFTTSIVSQSQDTATLFSWPPEVQ